MFNQLLKTILYKTIISNEEKYGLILSTILSSILFWYSPSYFLIGYAASYL